MLHSVIKIFLLLTMMYCRTEHLILSGPDDIRFQETLILTCTTSDARHLPLVWSAQLGHLPMALIQEDIGRWKYRTKITNFTTDNDWTSVLEISYSSIYDSGLYECKTNTTEELAVRMVNVSYDTCFNGTKVESIFVPKQGCISVAYRRFEDCADLGMDQITISSWKDQLVAVDLAFKYFYKHGIAGIGEQHILINLINRDRTFLWKDFKRNKTKQLTFTAWRNYDYQDEYSECVSISYRTQITNPFKSWIYSRCRMFYAVCLGDRENINSVKDIQVPVPTYVNATLPSRDRVFRCQQTEQYILSYFVCDNTYDCQDGSDENENLCNSETQNTEESKFRCENGKAISLNLVCDFYEDCLDGSDERNCYTKDCLSGEWKCHSGQCIPDYELCDKEQECADGSDEWLTTCSGYSKSIEALWSCKDKSHMPISRTCDLIPDCHDASDELLDQCLLGNPTYSCSTHCPLRDCNSTGIRVHLGSHGSEQVACSYNRGIVRMIWPFSVTMSAKHTRSQCSFRDVSEGSITIKLIDTKPVRIVYKREHLLDKLMGVSQYCFQEIKICSPRMYTSPAFTVSARRDGQNMQDLRYCGNSKNPCDAYFGCAFESIPFHLDCTSSYSTIVRDVPIRWVRMKENSNDRPIMVISQPVCTEDTSAIPRKYFEEPLACQNGYSYYLHQKCLMDFDPTGEPVACRDLTHLQNCDIFSCPDNFIKCPDSYCLHMRFLCDGTSHCPNGEDEIDCDQHTCPGHYQCHRSRTCIPLQQLCDGIRHCPRGDDERHCNIQCPTGCSCDGLIFLCENEDSPILMGEITETLRGLTMTQNLSDWSEHLPLNFPSISTLILKNCQIRSITYNNESVFTGLQSLITLDLKNNLITDLPANTFSTLPKLKYLFLHNNPIVTVDVRAFSGMHLLKELRLTSTLISTLKSGMFRECESVEYLNLSSNSLYSIENRAFENLAYTKTLDLRVNKIALAEDMFEGLTSLSLLYVDTYTLCCARPKSVTDANCFAPRDSISSCSDLIRVTILRVSLWVIGLSAVLGNLFVLIYRLKWDRANLKKSYSIFVISLSLSDILMGIYMIIIGVADTVFRDRYVWEEETWRHSLLCTMSGILSTVSSEASAFVILFITIDRTLAIVFPFSLKQFNTKSAVIASVFIWIISIIIAVLPVACCGNYFKGEFYSASGVCLALPLSHSRSPGSEYSVSVFVGLNFVIFAIIAICQVFIFRSSRAHISLKKTTHKRDADIAVARALFAVVATDFCCWFPIGVLGIWTSLGGNVSGDVYAWVMVFVLPINSALNPFLYTFGNQMKKRRARRNRQSSRYTGGKSETEMTNVVLNVLQTFRQRKGSKELDKHLSDPDTVLLVPDSFVIIQQVAKSLVHLHEKDLVHGDISTKSVKISVRKGRVTHGALTMEHSRVAHQYEQFDDIHGLGMLTKTLLKKVKLPL